jgi:hypothetical protein
VYDFEPFCGRFNAKIKQKYGVILKQFLEGGMKNFAFQNRVLQRDRVLLY